MPSEWTLSTLLSWWFGPPVRADRRPALDLPAPLIEFYAAISAYDIAEHNILLAPGEVVEVDGLLVFWLESDRVSEWATDGIEVYERTRDVGDDWHPTTTALADFLVSLVAFEAVMGADHVVSVDECGEDERTRLLDGLTELPMPGPFLDSRLLAGDDALAFTGEGFAYVAVRRPEQLIDFERRRD